MYVNHICQVFQCVYTLFTHLYMDYMLKDESIIEF